MSFKRLMQLLAALIALILLTIGVVASVSMERLNGFQSYASEESIFYAHALNDARQAQVDFQRQVQEWKNILIRGNDPELYNKYLKSFEDHETKVQTSMRALSSRMRQHHVDMPEISTLIDEHARLGQKYREALVTWNAADPETGKAVDKLLRGIDRPASAAMDAVAKKIETLVNDKLQSVKAEAADFAASVRWVFFACAALLLAAAMTLCWKISRAVLGRVGAEPTDLEAIFQKVAKGDLSVKLKISPEDTTSVAAQAQLMILRIRSMVRAVKNNASEVTQSSEKAQMGADATEIQTALRNAKVAVAGLETAMSRFKV